MDDWRYENLRDEIGRLRKEIREVEVRTHKAETWQDLLPLRVMIGLCWLFSAGMILFTIVRAGTH